MSPRQNRDSIFAHGLDWQRSEPETRLYGGGDEWPRGQYLFPTWPMEAGDEDDVYEVDVTGIQLLQDPYHEAPVAFYTTETISRERLRLRSAA